MMRGTILAVSGSAELLRSLESQLASLEVEVITATTFADAVTATACTWVDGAIVDSDIGMENGSDLCREILRQSTALGRPIALWLILKTTSPDVDALALEHEGVILLPRGFDLHGLVGEIQVRLREINAQEQTEPPSGSGPARLPQFRSAVRALAYSIANRLAVSFRYKDRDGKSGWRKAEPHVLGTDQAGNLWLVAYHPAAAGSTSGLPGWRTYRVDAMSNVLITIEPFRADAGKPRGVENLARVILRA